MSGKRVILLAPMMTQILEKENEEKFQKDQDSLN